MKSLLLTLSFCFHLSAAFANHDLRRITDRIVREGKKLYCCEMASWQGSEIFQQRFPDKKHLVGGHVSYTKGDQNICILYTVGPYPKALVTMLFDSTFSRLTAKIIEEERVLTPDEVTLQQLKALAQKEIDSTTFYYYKRYEECALNIIPVIDEEGKKVFVIAATTNRNKVVLGNDYLLTYSSSFKLRSKKRLHQEVFMSPLAGKNLGSIPMHTHTALTGKFITATDICTLMLYGKHAKWLQYIVVGDDYVSIWDCNKNELSVVTRKEWDRSRKAERT